MQIETLTEEKGKLIRVSAETVRLIEAAQRPRESYDQALLRLLDERERREKAEAPADSAE